MTLVKVCGKDDTVTRLCFLVLRANSNGRLISPMLCPLLKDFLLQKNNTEDIKMKAKKEEETMIQAKFNQKAK